MIAPSVAGTNTATPPVIPTAIKSLALTQIRDDFGLTKSAASLMFAVVYFGALPAMALTRWADRMRRVLGAWDEHLADPYLPRRLAGLMADAGLEVTDCRVVPLLNTSYSENSYSAFLIGTIAAFLAGRGGVTPDEVTAWADDLTSLGRDYFFSLNRYLFLARR